MVSASTDMSAPSASAPALPAGLVQQDDGLYIDMGQPAPALLAAINQLFLAQVYLVGLDYAVLSKVLYGIGPALSGARLPLVRLAAEARPFEPERRALYKAPRLHRDSAEYFFELLFLPELELPDGTLIPERPARLDFDEFVADLWNKGIRFGIDVAATQAAIASAKPGRITVARQLDPASGQDAMVVEVSQDLHRSDAPREKADGRIDLLSFQNRFPQIKKQMRLLKKQPSVAGQFGYDLAGKLLPPEPPKDLTLAYLAGTGTAVEQQADGEYLIATEDGFLNVDAKSSRISVTEKIISKEGVSGRTTGNLELAGAYEEFGDVQELRDVVGGDITVHGQVYGNIQSRGGRVVLDRNLVGGSVLNAAGDIAIAGVASGAVVQTRSGSIKIGRAENCVIAGTSVTVQEASNCEIIADEVFISMAEGCAVAGRNVEIESAGPRKRTEMLIFVLVRDVSLFDQQLAELRAQALQQAAASAAIVAEIERVSQQPDVRRYLALAAKLRTQELTLTAEQAQHLKKIAAAVGADLQALSKLTLERQVSDTQHTLLAQQIDKVIAQKKEAGGRARCGLHMVSGETLVRTMTLPPESQAALYELAPKDIKQRLRGANAGRVLFGDSSGSLDWHLDLSADPAVPG